MRDLNYLVLVGLGLFVFSVSYADVDLQDGLEAYYKLDGDATDSSGAGLDGTVHNATATTNRFGVAGGAMHFASQGDYLDMGILPEWDFGTNSFSVSLWFKADGIAVRKRVLLTVQNESQDIEFSIGYGSPWSNPESTDDKIGLGLNYVDSPPWGADVSGTQSLSDGEWHHVVLTRNGSSWNIYLDGSSIPEVSKTYPFDPGSGQLLIGTHITTDRTFPGAIDEVRIYRRVLNSSEITTLANDLYITGFNDGHLSWINADTNFYYSVEWKPSLTGSNDWTASYSNCQNIQSVNDTITVPVPVFYRLMATTNAPFSSVSVPKTGQSTSYEMGDDGDFEKGAAWPSPRFTDNSDGTVTDNLTRLVWLKNANVFGQRMWGDASSDCNMLNDGEMGLSDGSVEGDWRLPNVKELQSLVDFGSYSPSLPAGYPFTGVQIQYYWSSTTDTGNTASAWMTSMYYGDTGRNNKFNNYFVWPVRDEN